MRNSDVKQKMMTLSLVCIGNMVILLAVVIWWLHHSVLNERKAIIETQVESVLGLLDTAYNAYSEGLISEEQAKQRVFGQIASINYLNSGYIWIADVDGYLLAHPLGDQIIGRSLIDIQDSTGKYFVQEFIATSIDGGGFVDYEWPKPGSDIPVTKVGYVELFEPWSLVVGSGLYADDLIDYVLRNIALGVAVIAALSLASVFIFLRLSKEYFSDLRHDALFDNLTGLYSRRYLVELEQDLLVNVSPNHPLAVIFLDVDFFKKVNDQYGHSVGDKVLSRMGKLIRKVLSDADYAIRYGGEELVVLTPKDEEGAIALAEQIRAKVAAFNFRGDKGQHFSVTLSAGVATAQKDEALAQVITRADDCLYQAKKTGRDKVVPERALKPSLMQSSTNTE
ncbi:MAG: diguanylate cyclase [Pontibacterium sp.]